jgi:serine/threonine-protein kinase
MSTPQASARLRKAGFKPATKAQASTTVRAGLVISTEPPAGTELQLGSSVTMLVSSGPAPVRVPDVTGQSLTAAEATLTNAELAVGTVTQKVSTTQSPGTVLSQSPSNGSSVRAGSKVELTVAQAPKEVVVPDVRGATEAAAVAKLKHAGFTPKTASHPTSEPSQVGMVLEQSPAAGANARKGATVTITVGVLGTPTTPTTPTTTPTTPTTTPTVTTPPAAPPAVGG